MQDTVTSTEIRSQSPHNRTQTQAGQTDGASSIKTLADQLHLLSMRWPLTVGCTYTGRTELVFMLKTVCFLQQRNILCSEVLVILNIIIHSHLNHHRYHHIIRTIWLQPWLKVPLCHVLVTIMFLCSPQPSHSLLYSPELMTGSRLRCTSSATRRTTLALPGT